MCITSAVHNSSILEIFIYSITYNNISLTNRLMYADNLHTTRTSILRFFAYIKRFVSDCWCIGWFIESYTPFSTSVSILLLCIVCMGYVDTSAVYHIVRAQSVIKLYVIYNMLEVRHFFFNACMPCY